MCVGYHGFNCVDLSMNWLSCPRGVTMEMEMKMKKKDGDESF